jgi:6-pyruvoyltetrahydropterin/6-carboxytetrahydropterin synthase
MNRESYSTSSIVAVPPISCSRRIHFCSGHRVFGHENKCANVHGHNYVLFVTAKAVALDSVGRVVDFSVLREKIGGWIDENWDHGFIYFSADREMREMVTALQTKQFPLPSNPTAENMAMFVLHTVCPLVLAGTGVLATRIVLWETENCYAEASLFS